MKMFRPALAGVLPAFVLLVCVQLNAGPSACHRPGHPSWLSGDDAVNHHIWQPVGSSTTVHFRHGQGRCAVPVKATLL